MFFFFFFLTGLIIFFFFFFQAEDGIRDLYVTGVQTCALPILRCPPVAGSADLYDELIAAAHAIYGSHSGQRALHAKGIWCEATFTATDEATRLCRAAHFSGEP